MSGMFGQTAKFGQRSCLFYTSINRIVGFDWIFENRVGKLMRFTCVFNAFSTRIRQGKIDGR